MNSKYINKTHTYGKIWMLVTLCLFISVPALICVHLGVSPKINMIAKGLSSGERQQGIYFAGNLSEIQEILETTFKLTVNGRNVL